MGLKIGELAKATGTKVETVRYYERIGLLPAAERTSANYRAASWKCSRITGTAATSTAAPEWRTLLAAIATSVFP